MDKKTIEMTMEEFLEFIKEAGDSVIISFTVDKEDPADGE